MSTWVAPEIGCDYCHNTDQMESDEKYGKNVARRMVSMVRDINEKYLKPVGGLLPPHRLSPEGDWPKVGCETCHKGVYKPLYGITMLEDYGELRGVVSERPAPWEIPFLEEQAASEDAQAAVAQ
jgi:photosynthetic reaction center cytochrome c subunit